METNFLVQVLFGQEITLLNDGAISLHNIRQQFPRFRAMRQSPHTIFTIITVVGPEDISDQAPVPRIEAELLREESDGMNAILQLPESSVVSVGRGMYRSIKIIQAVLELPGRYTVEVSVDEYYAGRGVFEVVEVEIPDGSRDSYGPSDVAD